MFATSIAVACVAALCGASILVERPVGNATPPTVVQCPYDPPAVYGHPAFGLLDKSRCAAPLSPSEANDELLLGGVPLIAQLLGGNGTSVSASGQDVLFRGIGGTAADVTVSMEARGGWTLVLLVRLNRFSEGVLMTLFDDSGAVGNAVEVEAALRNCRGERCAVPGLFAAVYAMGETSLLQLIVPEVLSSGGIARFSVPRLFDGEWHLLGVVFEPMAAGHYVRVSLHVDGVDPFTAKLEQCVKAGAPNRLMTSPLGLWNTTRGALAVGGAQGSYHALLLYREALSRLAISAFGTPATMETAAGGSRGNLLAVCFTFISVAVVFSVWTALHFYRESVDVEQPAFEGKPNLNENLDEGIQDGGAHDTALTYGLVAKRAVTGAPYAAQMASSAAAAVSSVRASAVPVATSSVAVIVSISSICFEVPQQMSVLLSHMAFPSVFRDIFGNIFNMWSIRFDFPEVAVPPYALLLVVLVGLIVAAAASVVQIRRDRKLFALSLQNWRDRRTSYRILLRYIVTGVFRECTIAVDERGANDVVTALVNEFPTPAGCLSGAFFEDVLASVVPSPHRASVARALLRRCEHLLMVIPSDTVTTLCMCLIPQTTSRVVSIAEVSAMSRKLQTMAKSFDRTLWGKSLPPTSEDERENLNVRCDAFAKLVTSYAAGECTFENALSGLEGAEKREAGVTDPTSLRLAWESPLVTKETLLLAHVNTLVRAVLTWVANLDDVHMEAFANPLLEFHRQRRHAKEIENPNRNASVIVEDDAEVCEEGRSAIVEGGLLQSCRQALVLYSVLRVDEEAMANDKAPPYNRQAPTRRYLWLDNSSTANGELLSAHDVQLRVLAATKVTGAKARESRCAAPTTASQRCVDHSHVTLVRASESHLMSTTLDGRPMYRCCNRNFDRLKEALHGDEHHTGDECDDGEMFMCPEAACSFAICGRCLRREVGWLDMARVFFFSVAYNLHHLSPPLSSTLIVVLLEALMFPVTQIPLLVLTCSPSLSCWLDGCFAKWSVEFTVSFVLAVLLLTLRTAICTWICVELRQRQQDCDGVVSTAEVASNSLVRRNQRWEYFLNCCDRSLLRSMYVSTELAYIAWGPVMKLAFDVAVVLAASLSPTDSVAQKVAVGIVYVVKGVLLCFTNPNLGLLLDVLAKAVVVHQLVVLGLSSAATWEAGTGSAVVVVMLCVTSSFFILLVVVIHRTLVVPVLAMMWNESMSALIRRDAQSSLMHNDPETLKRMLLMQVETLSMKRRLCATLWDRIRATSWGLCSSHPISVPYSTRGGSQIAITAAMVLRTALERQRQVKASGNPKDALISDAYLAAVKRSSSALLLNWLRGVTSCGAFHDVDDSAFSLATRQLLDYERDALGDFLQRLSRRGADSASSRDELCFADPPLVDNEQLLGLVHKVALFLKPSTAAACSGGAHTAGPMTHCNQLQLLSAAQLTDNLDFSDCTLNGCSLIKGTRITSSDARRSDLSRAVMPDCVLAVCDLRDTLYLPQSFSSFTATLTLPHPDGVLSVAFSSDGTRIVSGSADRKARVWDACSGAELRVLTGHSSSVTSVAFSPGGVRIVSGSEDTTVRVWDASSGTELRVLMGHTAHVTSVAVSPDGARIVSGSGDETARLYDATTGGELRVLTGHTGAVLSVDFSPDGARIVSGSNDKTVRVWDASSGAELRVFAANKVAGCVVFSPDGTRIMHCGNAIRVLDAISGAELRVISGHITRAVFSPDGSCVVSGSTDNTAVCVWDAGSGTELKALTGHTAYVRSVAVSPDGARIVSGSDDKTVRVWDASSGAELRAIGGHRSLLNSVAISPHGARIASASSDKTIRVWDASSGAELLLLKGHTDRVNGVAFSSDGMRIVSGSDDKTVRVWDASNGANLRVINGHTADVTSVAFSPDGSCMVSGSTDKTIRVWDTSSGTELWVLTGHTAHIKSVAISRDGSCIVSGSTDKTIRVWDAGSGTELRVLTGHSDRVNSVAISPDGVRIVSGSDDKTVRVWDASSGVELRVLTAQTCDVSSVAFSSDGMRIVSGSNDRTVRVWDASTGTQLRLLKGHAGAVTSVALSPDGTRIVSCSYDRSVRVWDASNDDELRVISGHICSVTSVAYSPDGARIVSGSCDTTVRMWDASSGAELRVLKGHTHVVISVAFSPDGARIVSGSYERSLRVWDASSGALLLVFAGATGDYKSIEFSHDAARIISDSDDKTVRVWDPCSGAEMRFLTTLFPAENNCSEVRDGSLIVFGHGKTVRVLDDSGVEQVLEGHTADATCVAFSFDGVRIVSGSNDTTVRVWDAGSGTELRVLMGHAGGVLSVAFSPDGARIVSASRDQTVRLWDASNGAQLRVHQTGDTADVTNVVFSPDGLCIVCGKRDDSARVARDTTVRVWDASNGAELRVLTGHSDAEKCVAISPDGAHIVSGNDDQTLRVLDASNGAELRLLTGHTGVVTGVAFSPDGACIVSGSNDKTVRLWDTSSGAELRILTGHTAGVTSVAFSPDGARIVSGSNDKTVCLWDASSGAELRILTGHTADVTSVAFSPDGGRIASCSYDRSVRVWDASNGAELQILEGHTCDVTSVSFSPDGARIVSCSNDKTVRVWIATTNRDASSEGLQALTECTGVDSDTGVKSVTTSLFHVPFSAFTFDLNSAPSRLDEVPFLALCTGGDPGRYPVQSCRSSRASVYRVTAKGH